MKAGSAFPVPNPARLPTTGLGVPLAPFLRAFCGQAVHQSDPRTPRHAQQRLVIAPASIGASPVWAPGGALNRYRTFGQLGVAKPIRRRVGVAGPIRHSEPP